MRKLIVPFILVSLICFHIKPALAHGFGERYDLPVPLNLFIFGAALTVGISFIVIAFFVKSSTSNIRYFKYNLLSIGAIAKVLTSNLFACVVKALSVGIFILVIVAGIIGSSNPIDNISPTFIWVIWWIGIVYITSLFGNIWYFLNPWKTIFEWAEQLNGKPFRKNIQYKSNWDIWPAVILFFIFIWIENVYTYAASPPHLSVLIILYSIITWWGMAAFGKHYWLKHGEFFSVLFGFFSKLSITEVQVPGKTTCSQCNLVCSTDYEDCVDCYQCYETANNSNLEVKLNLRPLSVGLILPHHISTGTAAFVILMLASVTFDGLSETPIWRSIQNTFYGAGSLFGSNQLGAISTVGILIMPLIFLGLYMTFSWATKKLANEVVPVSSIAKAFVISLIPIALAYNLAHYIGLLTIQGQFMIPLLSDPLGLGWDIIGTKNYKIELNIINTKTIWYVSVGAIVIGHIISVYAAHVISLSRPVKRHLALKGQYPMLLLMIIYTASSLWIIAQPITER